MSSAEPWQTAEIAGPKKAVVIAKPVMARAVIDHAKHPVILMGSRVTVIGFDGEKFVDWLIRLARSRSVPVIAAGNTSRPLRERGYTDAVIMPAVEAAQRIADPDWKGPTGKGHPDLVIVAGLPYPMAWTLLSGLKHAAPCTKTLTLDPVYHPNATLSFANITAREWQESLKAIAAETEGAGNV